ncbi:hypothetical protein ACP4OV_006606 [Aristida adscensionis]
MASSFLMSLTVVEPRGQPRRAAHPMDPAAGATTPATPRARRVQRLLAEHRPWQMLDNVAAVIVEQTHAALLEILGPAAPLLDGGGGHVEFSRPVDPADPGSPLLCVNASAAHCRVTVAGGHHHHGGGDAPEQKGKTLYRLARTNVSVSPGTLHLARVDGGGGGGGGWKCAEVRPDVKARGVIGVLETIRARLDAAIRVEARLMEMASACGGGGAAAAEVGDIVEARAALERMREEVDLDAFVRGRCQKRRRCLVEEISGRPESDAADEAEALATRLTELHVSQKRRRRAPEASGQPASQLVKERGT